LELLIHMGGGNPQNDVSGRPSDSFQGKPVQVILLPGAGPGIEANGKPGLRQRRTVGRVLLFVVHTQLETSEYRMGWTKRTAEPWAERR